MGFTLTEREALQRSTPTAVAEDERLRERPRELAPAGAASTTGPTAAYNKFEFACHEGNYAMWNVLRVARAQGAAAAPRPGSRQSGAEGAGQQCPTHSASRLATAECASR